MSVPSIRNLIPLLPLVLGITDGILNALTLSAGAIIRGGDAIGASLALRVGIVALVTAGFTMFVADYAERRSSLVRAAHQLNMTRPGQLAATALGKQVFKESVMATAVAGIASLIGAGVPLFASAILPGPSWVVLVLTIGCLGALGGALGSLMHARRYHWAAAMLLGGIAIAAIGTWLNIT